MFSIVSDNWKYKTCKDCHFFCEIIGVKMPLLAPGAPKFKECRKAPPHTLVMMQQDNNSRVVPMVQIQYPKFPEAYPACSNFIDQNSLDNSASIEENERN